MSSKRLPTVCIVLGGLMYLGCVGGLGYMGWIGRHKLTYQEYDLLPSLQTSAALTFILGTLCLGTAIVIERKRGRT